MIHVLVILAAISLVMTQMGWFLFRRPGVSMFQLFPLFHLNEFVTPTGKYLIVGGAFFWLVAVVTMFFS